MNLNIKISPFSHFLKLNSKGNYVVYNSLFLKKFFCDKKIVNDIKKLDFKESSPMLKYLYKNRFVIDANIKPQDEVAHLIKREKLNFDNPIFKVFYIIVTTGCNFKCKYCYLASFTNYKPRVMSIKTAKRALSYFYNYMKKVKDKPLKLVLYGGEPLLNLKVVMFIIKDIRTKIKNKKIPNVSIILISNGSLIDNDIARFLKENKVLIAVSLDGPKNINDLNRVHKDGKGTYEDTIRAINLLNKISLTPTISCTVYKENVNKLNKIIPWMSKKFKIDSLSLNLFTGGDCSNKLIRKLSKDSAKEIINAFKACRKYGIYEDTVLKQMKSFVNETPNVYHCAATGREIAVDPNGNLATCPAFFNTKLFPLNVSQQPKVESDSEFKRWVKRSPLLNKKCYNCIAIGLCGGGCAFNSYKNYKDIYARDEFYCIYAKSITKWLLKDLYQIIKRRRCHG